MYLSFRCQVSNIQTFVSCFVQGDENLIGLLVKQELRLRDCYKEHRALSESSFSRHIRCVVLKDGTTRSTFNTGKVPSVEQLEHLQVLHRVRCMMTHPKCGSSFSHTYQSDLTQLIRYFVLYPRILYKSREKQAISR